MRIDVLYCQMLVTIRSMVPYVCLLPARVNLRSRGEVILSGLTGRSKIPPARGSVKLSWWWCYLAGGTGE